MGIIKTVKSFFKAPRLDPRGPNKFNPTTTAKPYGGAGAPGSPDHGSPGEGRKK